MLLAARCNADERPGGFTPVELLVTILLIAVVLCSGFSVYHVAVEKIKKVEAIIMLGALRGSETRFFTARNAYADRFELLDFNPNDILIGREPHFSYEIMGADAEGFVAAATRTKAGGGDGKSTVTIDESGKFGGTM